LRGAIGLSFSLIVYNDTQYTDKLRDIVLFDMAGNVILTLLINGTTTGFFVKLVGMSSTSKVK
jgi:NhaP-type Na+/H+ or K+/H+ antiporter